MRLYADVQVELGRKTYLMLVSGEVSSKIPTEIPTPSSRRSLLTPHFSWAIDQPSGRASAIRKEKADSLGDIRGRNHMTLTQE